jgi:hypothetical protein
VFENKHEKFVATNKPCTKDQQFYGGYKRIFLNNPLKISTHKLCIKRLHFLGGGKWTSLLTDISNYIRIL